MRMAGTNAGASQDKLWMRDSEGHEDASCGNESGRERNFWAIVLWVVSCGSRDDRAGTHLVDGLNRGGGVDGYGAVCGLVVVLGVLDGDVEDGETPNGSCGTRGCECALRMCHCQGCGNFKLPFCVPSYSLSLSLSLPPPTTAAKVPPRLSAVSSKDVLLAIATHRQSNREPLINQAEAITSAAVIAIPTAWPAKPPKRYNDAQRSTPTPLQRSLRLICRQPWPVDMAKMVVNSIR